ncbi:hypothetical protein CTAYLR_001438 [Chrysophaeum taylorii]|uniref:guanine deaminase n=1 Tax=Chrysophaeum taylorii TaxID=2483200 RepID=A0AAD7U8X3_9STRA|nr:hypothetical protein CTAYLR_001438 [Chrysophaeum taylorii]
MTWRWLSLMATTTAALVVGPARQPKTRLHATRTQHILETLEDEGDGQGAGSSGTYEGLKRLDASWRAMRDGTSRPLEQPFVTVRKGRCGPPGFDVCVLGGTLGIFAAAALQRGGAKCVVVERGRVAGRNQEWNLSLDEVWDLVAAGVFDASDVDGAVGTPDVREVFEGEPGTLVASHFGSVRAGFNDRESDDPQEIWMPSVLNIGVRPDVAVARARANFEGAGGVVLEETSCAGVEVFEDGVRIVGNDDRNEVCAARLVVDAMGNASPISRQTRTEINFGVEPRPSGVCCVVGTAAKGYASDNSYGDLIYTNEDSREDRQYFWEAFPAASLGPDARTTYLFTYLDASDRRRHSVEAQFEDYWDMLPLYQRRNAACFAEAETPDRSDLVDRAIDAGHFQILRCLYGIFPTYKDSPLRSRWNRIVAIGDASGTQSPLSFGGFGALTRHVDRVCAGILEALDSNALQAADLAALNPYTPNLAATWMFQRAFVVPVTSSRPANFVNRLMRLNYDNMKDLGNDVLRPFNQDVVQPRGLLKVLALATLRDPINIPNLLYYIGPRELADWLRHFLAMLAGPFVRFGDKNGPGSVSLASAQALVVVDPRSGRIAAAVDVGDPAYSKVAATFNTSRGVVVLGPTQFLMPGLVDAHAHAPQHAFVGNGLDLPLLEWLDEYTFPAEAKFEDVAHARRVYDTAVRRHLRNGSTTVSYFGTIHVEATLELVAVCRRRGQRAHVGKVSMDANAPAYYIEPSAEASAAATARFVAATREGEDGRGLVTPSVVPRFAPSCTADLLARLGTLSRDLSLPVHTHLSENRAECDWVMELFPDAASYADVYDRAGLLHDRSYFAHCVFCDDLERDKVKSARAGVVHCPNSNFIVGRALCDVRRWLDDGVSVALGTDVAGGWSTSMLDAVRLAVVTSRLVADRDADPRKALTWREALYLATKGGANVLGLDAGEISRGRFFDALLVDASTGPLDAYPDDDLDALFEKFVWNGDDRNLLDVYVAGVRVSGARHPTRSIVLSWRAAAALATTLLTVLVVVSSSQKRRPPL